MYSVVGQYLFMQKKNEHRTHRNEFKNLVKDDHRCAEIQHGFPFDPVEGSNGKQRL
jgi:hypothetical protein